ncbi:quinate dehydrogenase [Verticillium alfalfae VaMs.102]|uniref:Quinate dehydrogenase n=1 Tax=Verticillium alfalfae (strain VaMs.102 / ATCC MYA-4576 / FGSC 10136) TaxID=526221 RepID=C9SU89_VERA1|nr:quinate dehydrogenase [Verticillium alfalfae VaMs.102]EEY22400.1 quinate dehydrogenase [Verticillium alfalfae VaMs.102]
MSATLTITPSAQLTNTIKAERCEAVERHGYLFGQKITHSLSPFLHGTIYNEIGLKWEQTRLDSADIPMFLELIKDPNFYDVVGVRESFYQKRRRPRCRLSITVPPSSSAAVGAARSAVYALRKWMKVTDIYLVNRDDAEVQAVIEECTTRGYGQGLRHIKDAAEVASLESVGAIVACVPNFTPQTAEEKAARAVIEAFLGKETKGAMLEMCYNPTPFTELGALAEDAGWQVILGTEAMIWQGLEQDRYWTGRELDQLPVKKVQEAIASRLGQASKL